MLLLWVFQTIFLDRFYESIRLKQVNSVANVIASNINDKENLTTLIQRQAQDNEACIRVIYNFDEDIRTTNQMGCAVERFGVEEILKYTRLALNNNGNYVEKTFDQTKINTVFGQFVRKSNDTSDLIHSSVIQTDDENFVLILVSARLTPVNATVSTLKVQLYYVGFILILMAVILTWIITYRIVKPLEKISEGAKVLANGNYDVEFNASGYREVQELSDTMNYASLKLKEVDTMRRDLIANVSHDLRTPLTMIGGYGELMRDLPEENTRENAQVIIDETKRLTTLVNDLLDLSKLQANQIQIQVASFNITHSIETIMKRYHKTLHKEKLTMTFEKDSDVIVVADEARIIQVMENFINNAIHYSGHGKKIILRQIEQENKVRIEVQDFGEGIPENKLNSIWERYYKIDKEHVRSVSGSGLGLSIVKEILTLHQVEFGVQSKENEGSLFYFYLPTQKKDS